MNFSGAGSPSWRRPLNHSQHKEGTDGEYLRGIKLKQSLPLPLLMNLLLHFQESIPFCKLVG
jgi:hypothetical protein